MREIPVQTSTHPYKIWIGEKLRFDLGRFLPKTYTSTLIITDENVAGLYLEDVKKGLPGIVYEAIIPAGEQSKSLEQFYQLQTAAIEKGLNRKSLIVALGGGVVGDLAGFVAATFMRGIDYVQVPTTILAHDSSVGGKVAINHELGKNLIGNFYPPQAVIYDVETVNTLGSDEVRSGYAELVKEALISDAALFHEMMNIRLADLTGEQLIRHLQAGIEVKADIVQEDERESGVRMFLNFGHTLGHAIEAELGYGAMTHGEAIAIGMLFALSLSESHYGVSFPQEELADWMKENSYPLELPQIEPARLLEKMSSDKKVTNDRIPMILLKEIGKPETVEFSKEELGEKISLFIGKLVKS